MEFGLPRCSTMAASCTGKVSQSFVTRPNTRAHHITVSGGGGYRRSPLRSPAVEPARRSRTFSAHLAIASRAAPHTQVLVEYTDPAGPACKVFQLTFKLHVLGTTRRITSEHGRRNMIFEYAKSVRDVHNFMHTTRILSLQVGTGAEPQSGFCYLSLPHFEGRTHTAGKHPAPGSSGSDVYVMYEGLHVAHPRTGSRPSTRVSQRRSR